MVDKDTLHAIAELLRNELEPIKQRLDNLESSHTRTNLLIEQSISRKIDIIGEGHDFLKQRLNDALQMEIKREKMELELNNLRADVNKIKHHLDIA